MQNFVVPRHNDVDLAFRGEKLADVNSRDEYATRWTRIVIYKTDSEKYVVEVLGESSLPDEVTLRKVHVCNKPEEVKYALRRKAAVPYLTHLALMAIDAAAAVDNGIAAVAAERI